MEINDKSFEKKDKPNTTNFNEFEKKNPHGITTGSAATAAALAAFLSLNNKIDYVDIKAPFDRLKIHVNHSRKLNSTSARACVIKMPYNDPDVTKNMEICADIKIIETPQIKIKGGKGVGIVTKPGLQVPVGEHAINPVPRKMIKDNLKSVLPEGKGIEIIISVPDGEEIAKKTMNPRLGITGGISILGTTGIARPMSSKAYKESLKCQIDVAIAEGHDELIFVPGNIGEKLASHILSPKPDRIVQMGNFAGYMLEEASKSGARKVTLFGHAGKLIKIAAGIFNTKNSIADGRKEIIAAYAALSGAKKDIIELIFRSDTVEEMIDILERNSLTSDVFNKIADSIKEICEDKYQMYFDVIIVRLDGTILNEVV